MELTATPHVGIHRYTFADTSNPQVLIDLGHGIGDKPLAGEVSILDDHTIVGMRHSRGWAKSQHIFFIAQFDHPFVNYGTQSDNDAPQPGSAHDDEQKVKAWVSFAPGTNVVIAKVALSTTSVEGARRNMLAEAPDFNFDSNKEAAHRNWMKQLQAVSIQSGSEEDKRTFYTALYHCLVASTLISDVDGTFRGADHQVHAAEHGNAVYSTFSLWDTFRAEHPLFTLLRPDLVNAFINSFALQAKYHPEHRLPIWPLYGHETYCMIGYHSFPVIAEAYAKGIRGWDAEQLYAMMARDAARNDSWANDELYIPADKEKEAVSKTLEFAYDDWSLAQFAKMLGKTADAEKYLRRAGAYRQVFDSDSGFMRGRLADGTWRTPFDPIDTTKPVQPHDFTEGNSWQYSFFVPHDVEGLAKLNGGHAAFVRKLDQLFDHAPVKNVEKVEDVSGLIGQYAHGNEPSHHVAYLYSYAGAPAKTAERVRAVQTALYNSSPGGLCGNEDCGQMSAWYVFSALGFYPVNPVQATYVFGSPLFADATLHLPNGKDLRVVAHDASATNRYIADLRLNGKPLPRVYITHDEILAGGTLEFDMSSTPSAHFGIAANAALSSMTPATGVAQQTATAPKKSTR